MRSCCHLPLRVVAISLLYVLMERSPLWCRAQVLPPPEDTPEEILQTEIITEAVSPVDGRSLTAAEYAELQGRARLSPAEVQPRLVPKVIRGIDNLRLRRLIKQIFPFL